MMEGGGRAAGANGNEKRQEGRGLSLGWVVFKLERDLQICW